MMNQKSKESILRGAQVLVPPPGSASLTEYRELMGILRSALDIAEGILVNGGETSDAEAMVIRICKAYGAEEVNVWAIISVVQGTMRMPSGLEVSLSKRIYDSNINLFRLQRMNQIAETYIQEKPDEKQRRALYEEACHAEPFPRAVFLMGGLICTFGWCLYFDGSLLDALCSGLIGFVLLFCKDHILQYFNNMATTILLSAFSGMLAAIFLKLGFVVSYSFIAIGIIMLLIPTLQVANGIRELFGGDIVCGTLRILQAMLTTSAIALGFMIAMLVFKFAPNETAMVTPVPKLVLSAGIGVLGYAIVFKASLNRFVPIILGGLATAGLWVFLQQIGIGVIANTYWCSIFITGYAMIFSKIVKDSNTNTYLLPILTILLPGKYFYYSTYYIVIFDQERFWSNVSLMSEMIFGIVFGIITVNLTVHFILEFLERRKKRDILKK